MKYKIEINDKSDRESLALILVKSGYAVRIVPYKSNTKTKYYVEYEMEDKLWIAHIKMKHRIRRQNSITALYAAKFIIMKQRPSTGLK